MGIKNPFTQRHIKYWTDRKIDWEQAYWNPDHPHRDVIIKALKGCSFNSIIEVGCASGVNLYKIKQAFPHVEVGGIDLNEDAIALANQKMPDAAVFEVSSVTSMFLSDKSVDVILSDMCLIYLDPFTIDKALQEIKRVARNRVLFLEFHSFSWFRRLALRLLSGYNAYNYEKLLQNHGFYDIQFYKLTEADWPGGNPQKEFAYVITAKL